MKPHNLKNINGLPEWKKFQEMIEGIWQREYYTNHGPLLVDLEDRIGSKLGVRHAICMTNSSIALMIALKALGVKGKIIIPSFSHINIAQSVKWAGLEIEYCNVNNNLFSIDPNEIKKKIDKDVELIIAINDYGMTSDIDELEELSKRYKLKLLFISDSFFGYDYQGKRFGNFGNLEIFSFHEKQLVNGADGACICTSDDILAERLRNIRSSYGARKRVPIPYTGNGRMSEIQAGLVSLSMDNFEKNKNEIIDNNKEFQKIVEGVKDVSIYNGTINGHSFVLVVNCKKLGIDLQDLRKSLKSINQHIELFCLYGVEASFPYRKKDFSNQLNTGNAFGIPGNISVKQFNEVISILLGNNF